MAKAAKKTAPKKIAKKAAAPKAAAPKKAAVGSPLAKGPVKGKGYTKLQLAAHLADAVSAQGQGELSRKAAAVAIDEVVALMIRFAKAGAPAPLPGLGKLVMRTTKARPARKGINPKTGEEITIPAKKAGKKLVFRISKQGKQAAGLV
jgi:nucleoid DNA-binding protein